MLSLAFKNRGVDLQIKTATDISLEVDKKLIDKPDFAIFWDKDIYLAERLEQNDMRLFNSKRAVMLCDNKILMYQELAKVGIIRPGLRFVLEVLVVLGRDERVFRQDLRERAGQLHERSLKRLQSLKVLRREDMGLFQSLIGALGEVVIHFVSRIE